jgi:hypothetical protein
MGSQVAERVHMTTLVKGEVPVTLKTGVDSV